MKEARQSLEGVSSQSRETVFLAVPGTGGLVCERVIQSMLPVRVLVPAGTCLPLRCTAAGKLMLAFGCHEELKALLSKEENERASERASMPGIALARELREIRERGYATTADEFEAGASSVAAPVRDHSSRVVGVVGIVGPTYRVPHTRLEDELSPLVTEASRAISLRMGYREPVDRTAVPQVPLRKRKEPQILVHC